MESVIAQGIQMLLPYQNIQRIAFEILWIYHQNPAKVASLQVLSLKIIMKKKVKKSDRPAKVFYRVLFKEEQDLYKFTDRCPLRKWWQKSVAKIVYPVHDFFTGYPKTHKIYQELRTNPHLMLAILNQNLDKGPRTCVYFTIKRNHLKICTLFNGLVAEIPHTTGIEYDTHWADVFARMAFSRSFKSVSLRIQGDEDADFEFLCDHLLYWIDTLKPTIPKEGWQEAIENGKQPIYEKSPQWIIISEKTSFLKFSIHRKFCPYSDYWGYLS